MNRESEVIAVVRQFIEDLGQDPNVIVPEANLANIGIDSLHAIDLVFRFEGTFGIVIPMEDFRATTVAEAVAFVLPLLPASKGVASAA